MSFDIELVDAGSGERIQFGEVHGFNGGTYRMGGTSEAWLNITYNYGDYKHIDAERGIRWLYGKTGEETLPRLRAAVEALGNEQAADCWASAPGNAGHALLGLIAFAEARPDGIWQGD
jgi:hypothetical protein